MPIPRLEARLSKARAPAVVDTLPPGMTFVSASAGCMEAGGVVTCDLGTLAVGEMSEVKFTVAAPQAEGVITNSAVVSADELDINPTDNSSSVDTTVMMYHVYLPMAMR